MDSCHLPTKELWGRLKKLAPDHFSPGVSCGHSRGREIFGLLNCFSASIASLSLSLWKLVTLFQPDGVGCPKIRCGHCISWGSKLGRKGVPAPSSAIAKMCQHPLGLPSLGMGQNMVRAHLGKQVWEAGEGVGGWLERSPPCSRC